MNSKLLLPRVAAAALLMLLAGCSGVDGLRSSNMIIPPDVVTVSKSLSVPMESIAAAAAVYLIVDPLAPNWQIEQSKLNDNRYRIAMRKKRFNTGGDGEVMPAFNRRAEQLVRDHGAQRYRIIEFNEGVDSGIIGQRVAQGVVELLR
jgi:hypothetical protein